MFSVPFLCKNLINLSIKMFIIFCYILGGQVYSNHISGWLCNGTLLWCKLWWWKIYFGNLQYRQHSHFIFVQKKQWIKNVLSLKSQTFFWKNYVLLQSYLKPDIWKNSIKPDKLKRRNLLFIIQSYIICDIHVAFI